ncbi:hypothetical protein CSKR_109088, partial [Clonorchis sinensis]
ITILLQNKPDDDPRFSGCAKLLQRSPRCYLSKRLYDCKHVNNYGDMSVFSVKIERNMMEIKHRHLTGDLFAYTTNRISNNKAADCLTVAGDGNYHLRMRRTSSSMTVVGLYEKNFCGKNGTVRSHIYPQSETLRGRPGDRDLRIDPFVFEPLHMR